MNSLLYQELKKIPKIELHRHLEASFSLEAARPYLRENLGFDELCLTPSKTLEDVLKKFEIIQDAFQTQEAVSKLTYEAHREASKDNIKIVEFRFSPSFMANRSKLSWEEIVEAVIDGVKKGEKDFDLVTGLILISSRDYGVEACAKTIDLALKYQDDIVGVDLAGPERGFPPSDFALEFFRAHNAGLHVTIHSGETEFAENVRTAVHILKAERIGHGIQVMHEEDILKEMIQKQIPFEISLTSNFITQAVTQLEKHPVKMFFERGLPVSLNTDDPLFFGIDLTHEYEVALSKVGLSQNNLKQILTQTYKASFIPESKKSKYRDLFL
ncbi:MAG: adenosine deaminase [Deltaproteobacteria bacterium]|nr:adenosine deaminase [Deltaproteobacteria bacterium]